MATLSSLHDDDDALAAINIVPFVDVVLVLLIIFMLTATAIARASMEVKLPKAATGGSRVSSTLNLVYNKAGNLLVNGEQKSFDEAAAIIKQEAALDAKTQAVISADKSNPYGDVVALIDLIKLGGIKTFALNIERIAR